MSITKQICVILKHLRIKDYLWLFNDENTILFTIIQN